MNVSLTWPATFRGTDDGKQAAAKKVVFCIPTITRPFAQNLAALEASLPVLEAAGWTHAAVWQVGCPYISAARAIMLRKALDAGADVVVFIDHDLSWRPADLLRLIEADGDVVSGLYRFKYDPVEYMGRVWSGLGGYPVVRESDGAIKALCVPAGFLKVTRAGVNKFMSAYPELAYGEKCNPHVDLFNHGAHDGVWYGEDYAFSRRWVEKCGEIWVVPDLDLTHHSADEAFPGNFHRYMCAQPGGSESANPILPAMRVFA